MSVVQRLTTELAVRYCFDGTYCYIDMLFTLATTYLTKLGRHGSL